MQELLSGEAYLTIKEQAINGRYVTHQQIVDFLGRRSSVLQLRVLGRSVEKRDLQLVTLGAGPLKIFMWSQMHGNEATTTKAVLDLLNFLEQDSKLAQEILQRCSLAIIPMLNPDGAQMYTRANARQVDLNRDAIELSQPESRALREAYDSFKPDFCFNLHDQRTIFNVGHKPLPATLSFLAPAHDRERSISRSRERSMQLIAAINERLQHFIPGQVGRYDDSFNPNCVGDAFQAKGTPTILFEAGHYPGDYQREKTREYVFKALVAALHCIKEEAVAGQQIDSYFQIPENNKLFFDVLIRNAQLLNVDPGKKKDVGILYKEVLEKETVLFESYIEETGNLQMRFGHETYDCSLENDLERLRQKSGLIQLIG